uniref:Uncharacterized protein n=1 Tax=Romanomermis culicivorax TaxID=13658 RepID=A0A915KFZ2_ROMCU
MPNFCGYTLVGFNTKSIIAADIKNFQFAVPMPADSTASSYPRYIQLAFPNSMMYIFETFTATLEDWTALFSLVDRDHTIIISFDRADNWAGIYALLGTHRYGFIPEAYNAPALFPHDSLDAAEIDHLAETLIAAFHNITLTDVLPPDAVDKIYLTISQIALPFDCISSDHGRSFCLGTQPNGFRETLTCTMHP